MADGARSTDPRVQAALDRLAARSPGRDVLGLGRITTLLGRLGEPHLRLPPAFHIAGTNGKGSTVAILRAMLEAAGHRVHVFTSPHLVRFNERIRLAGRLVDDAVLADALERVLAVSDDVGASFFEVTTAAAFDLFAATPADACIIEVGLGGRLDATNVIPHPIACGIASLGLDHEEFLLAPEPGVPTDPMSRIAFEKAMIARQGVPLITQSYTPSAMAAVSEVARATGALWSARGVAWDGCPSEGGLWFRDAAGELRLPAPALEGSHQVDNALLAVALARGQSAIALPVNALARGLTGAVWPARIQPLGPGPLRALVRDGGALWVDGGHNVDAARRLATWFEEQGANAPRTVVLGLLANKDAAGVLATLAPAWRDAGSLVRTVNVPGHASHHPEELAAGLRRLGVRAEPAADLSAALAGAAGPAMVLGSLYLAGVALALNGEAPD